MGGCGPRVLILFLVFRGDESMLLGCGRESDTVLVFRGDEFYVVLGFVARVACNTNPGPFFCSAFFLFSSHFVLFPSHAHAHTHTHAHSRVHFPLRTSPRPLLQARFEIAAEETLREKRALETRLAPLEQELLTKTDALGKHTARANAAMSELGTSKSELSAAKRRIAELEQNEAALMEHLRHTQAEGQKHAEQVSQLESHLVKETTGVQQMNADREKMRATIALLENDLQLSRAREESMAQELSSLKRDVSDLQNLRRTERSESERQLVDAKDELAQLAEEGRKRHIEYVNQK